ncbi:MAG: hypothetical protein Ta2B_20240 [Termitinemataceae bacterium]|nr:MAG: hypothetical protein Ta2B_20240 [Termitinemataceae bacterium]
MLRNLVFKVLYLADKIWKRERRVSFGNENPDKTFYIIKCGIKTIEGAGVFGMVEYVLGHIDYALKRAWIPVVDFQNINNQYLEPAFLGKENAWEYFFMQPMAYTLKDIEHSKNIVISIRSAWPGKNYVIQQDLLVKNKNYLKHYKDLFVKYIKYTNSMQEYLDSEYKRILDGKGRVLGVLCRGTDYVLHSPPSHPIQPDAIEVIKKAEVVMKEQNCSFVYIATESQENYNLFKNHFGEKLLDSGQKRFCNDDFINVRWLAQVHFNRENDRRMRGIEYCSTINLLSKCTCFIGGLTTGTCAAHIQADNYEYDYVWDLGYYPPPSFWYEMKRLMKKYFFGLDTSH